MIINKTKQQIICGEEIICATILSRARGLMLRKERKNAVIVLPSEQEISLHMVFVFYPIDVLIVNNDNIIVEIKRQFLPYTFWRSSKKGSYVVEIAEPAEYEIGDIIEVINEKMPAEAAAKR